MASLTRARAMPWLMVLELAVTLRKHWKRLDAQERELLAQLVKKSQGRPHRLTSAERAHVRRLVAKLEPGQIARSVVPIGRRAAKGRRGR
jgi:hypothetical protein